MKNKFILVILVTAIASIILSGCWDRKELNELGIVMAIGLDKDNQTGEILLTSQVVRPAALQKQGGSAKESPYEIVITSGNTVFEAVRNTVKEFDRRSFFSHIKVIVIGESLAREGLNEIIDFVSRSHEIRKFTWVIVANGNSARDMLGVKHGIENVQANYMEGIIKRQSINSDVSTSGIIDFIKKMTGEGINPVTGVFKIVNVQSIPTEGKEPELRKGLTLSGTAAFKKDKLIGFLNEKETLGLNILTGNRKSGAVHIPSPVNDKELISIEIKKFDTKITPVIEDGKILFNISIKAGGNVTEVQGNFDVSDPLQFESANGKLTELIEDSVNDTIKKVQGELGTDIIGFGSAIERKYPGEWNKIKDQWDTIFPKVAYKLKAEAHLRRTGLLLKPMNVKKAE